MYIYICIGILDFTTTIMFLSQYARIISPSLSDPMGVFVESTRKPCF